MWGCGDAGFAMIGGTTQRPMREPRIEAEEMLPA